MTFKVIRGQGQGVEMTSVPFRDYFYLFIQFAVDGTDHFRSQLLYSVTEIHVSFSH